MATILDVAKLAGVSQGTASNVLNGKGNVSSEKIKLVEEAAKQLGYTINERAKILRKGSGNLIGVILPSIEYKKYREFFYSFKHFMEQNGYIAELFLSNENPQTEIELIQRAQAMMAAMVVTITCIKEPQNYYADKGFEKVCFVERRPEFAANYYGFDYEAAGQALARTVRQRKYKKVLLITDSLRFSNEKEFYTGFQAELDKVGKSFSHMSTNIRRISSTILNMLTTSEKIDAIVVSNSGFAEEIKKTAEAFHEMGEVPIYTLSTVVSLPERNFYKYEMNYSLLGREVAAALTQKDIADTRILDNDGFRDWTDINVRKQMAPRLHVLTLESPEANIMQGLAKLYTEKTGTEVKISIFSYDEIYEQFLYSQNSDLYDVLRIDVTWLSWFAERLFVPLEEIDSKIKHVFAEYIPALVEKYSCVNGKIYALPVTPSAQLLFYRKDLFESNVNKRLYREKYKRELKVPESFGEYNQIAEFFFDLAEEGETDVRYGTGLTLGNTGVASTEFLARLFSHKKWLYDERGRILVNDAAGLAAMQELMEAQKYAPQKIMRWWTTEAQEFAAGELAMMINFSNYASEILGRNSKVAENIGFGVVPGGNPIYGGGTLAVSKNSGYKEDAVSFIKWITKEPVASAMAMLGSVSPCLKTYSKYDIIDTFPWLELSKESFAYSTTNRMPENASYPFDEKRFLNILGTAVKNVITGIYTMQEALNQAQELIDKELNFRHGSFQ